VRKHASKYLSCLLIVFSLLALSFKDSVELLHTFAHAIPNPFHHHELKVRLQHHPHAGKTFFTYAHHGHSHSLSDHTHFTVEKKDSSSSSEKENDEAQGKSKLHLFCVSSSEIEFATELGLNPNPRPLFCIEQPSLFISSPPPECASLAASFQIV
jgi:hypothetical protein